MMYHIKLTEYLPEGMSADKEGNPRGELPPSVPDEYTDESDGIQQVNRQGLQMPEFMGDPQALFFLLR